MNIFSTQQQQNKINSSLRLAFLINKNPPIPQHSSSSTSPNHSNNKQHLNNIIISSSSFSSNYQSFNYLHHYLKDIQSNFPDIKPDKLKLLTCPKIITNQWQIKQIQQWKQLSSNFIDVSHWYPVFIQQSNFQLYLDHQLQIIGIILEIDHGFKGFLGYVPNTLQVFDVAQAFCSLYSFNLSNNTFFYPHLLQKLLTFDQIKKYTISQLAGNYIKIQCFIQNQPPKQLNINDNLILSCQSQQYQQINNYDFIKIDNHMNDILILSDHQIFPCDPENEILPKLLKQKTLQQLTLLKKYAKQLVQNANIQIPKQSQQILINQLNIIILQLLNSCNTQS